MANGEPPATWMTDVQRALAILFVGTFCLIVVVMVIKVTFWGDIPTVSDILKIIIPAMINLVTFVAGYFYGSSKAKDQSDASQQRVVDKLTSTPPGTLPPTPSLAVVAPWWSKLADTEKAAITAAGPNDPRIAAVIMAMTAGAATPDDLAYLVSKGLLTQERADAIKT